jgi:hypothetical protein
LLWSPDHCIGVCATSWYFHRLLVLPTPDKVASFQGAYNFLLATAVTVRTWHGALVVPAFSPPPVLQTNRCSAGHPITWQRLEIEQCCGCYVPSQHACVGSLYQLNRLHRSPMSEGFVGDPWLSITLSLCHILHSVSHWPVLVYYFNSTGCSAGWLLHVPT